MLRLISAAGNGDELHTSGRRHIASMIDEHLSPQGATHAVLVYCGGGVPFKGALTVDAHA